MYNCSVDDIKATNAGKIGKNGQLKAGSDIIIPIGQPPKDTEPQGSFLAKKVKAYFMYAFSLFYMGNFMI